MVRSRVADGETVKIMTVTDDYVLQSSDYPTVPDKTGYTGAWQQHTAAIHADVTVQAVYTILQYTVTFVADDTTVKTMTVNYGYVLQESDYPPVPAKDEQVGRWTEYTAAIKHNVSILAVYYDPYHTVTFIADGVTVKTMSVSDGYILSRLDYPPVPLKPGYSGAWQRYSVEIHKDIQLKAIYRVGSIQPDPGEIASVEDPVETAQLMPAEGSTVDLTVSSNDMLTNAVSTEVAAENNAVTASVHDGQTLVSSQTVQHDYITQNGKVVRETVTTNGTVTAVMDFIYDESGTPFALKYSTNGGSSFTTYYYVVNLQGDVVKLVNSGGTAYATYTYNAWGEVLTATGSMASINPLRYRGYYYDSETGFYYLQSRYYDPVTHRFINADSLVSTGQGFVGTNMYSYCGNHPVNRVDHAGRSWSDIWEFIETAIDEIGKAIEIMTPAYAGCGGVAAADGPLPVGDIIGLFAAAVITIGTIGYGIYQAIESPAHIKVEENEKVESTTPPRSPVYDGADKYGGVWKIVTPPMSFGEATSWVTANAMTGTYGKNASWGLYTTHQIDALVMAVVLGGGFPESHSAEAGTYAHFHVRGYNLFDKYKHFHIWYGEFGGK